MEQAKELLCVYLRSVFFVLDQRMHLYSMIK